MSTGALVGAVFLLLVIAGGAWLFSTNDEVIVQEETVSVESSQQENNNQISTDSAQQNGFAGRVLAGDASAIPLLDFTQTDYETALASDKLVILYFYANWCPICRLETENALYPAFNELEDESVVGFRVNYKDSDTDSNEEALAKEFNVTYQHTKVFIKNGERVLKALDSWGKDRYLSEIFSAV